MTPREDLEPARIVRPFPWQCPMCGHQAGQHGTRGCATCACGRPVEDTDRCTGTRCGHYRSAHGTRGCKVMICGCEVFRAEVDR